jgi:hypothetical protein
MCPQYWKHAYAQHSHHTGTGKKDESSPFRPGRDSSTNVITAVRCQQVPSLFEGYTHFRRTPALPASATRVFFFFFANPHDDHWVVVSAGLYYANWWDRSLRLIFKDHQATTNVTSEGTLQSCLRIDLAERTRELTCGRLKGMPQDCTRRARREA